MAQGEGFKHITVTAADDDDVVIVAGAVEAPAQNAGDAPAAEEPEPSGSKKDSFKKDSSKKDSPKKDAYRETTLEDLKQEPMPFAQRVVIIAAIVCIIGALIYYFAFMR